MVTLKDFVVKPTNDLAFKKLFGGEISGGAERLIDLLHSILWIKITKLSYEDRARDRVDYSSKEVILDINVMINEAINVDLEIQMVGSLKDLGPRSLVYSSKLVSVQPLKGEPYRNMNQVKCIFFVRKGLDIKGEGYVHRALLKFEDGELASDKLEVIFIDLEKFEKMKIVFEEMNDLDKWCYFLLHCNEDDEIMVKLSKNNEIFEEAEKTMREFSDNEFIKLDIFRREMFQLDMENNRILSERAKEEAERASQEVKRANQEVKRANQEVERANQEAERANQEAERANQEAEHATLRAEEESLRASNAERALAEEKDRITATVRALYERGMDVGVISDITKLSLEEINGLLSK